ncbi:MAG: leucine-rich repeat protein, partial [Acutalibacteraceae bacterium]
MNKTLKKTVACFLTVLMLLTSIPLEGIAGLSKYLLDFGLEAGAVETVLGSGSCGVEGSDVTWTLYDNGQLVISGSGAMSDYYFEEPPAKKETARVLSTNTIDDLEPTDEQEEESALTDLLSESQLQIVDVPEAINPVTFAAEMYEAAEPEVESQAVLTPWYDYTYDIQSVVIEEGITHIGDYAFAFFMDMTSVQLPQSLVSIGIGAFAYCTSLQAIDLPNGLEEIGEAAFLYCFEISQLAIPQSVETIGGMAFYMLLSLESLDFPGSSVNLSEEGVFGMLIDLKELTIPEDAAEREDLNYLFATSFKIENIYNYSDSIVSSDKTCYFDSYEAADYFSIYYKVLYKYYIESAFNGTEPDEIVITQSFIDEVNRKYNKSYTLGDLDSLIEFMQPQSTGDPDYLTIHCKQASAEHETCKANFASHVLLETGAECLCFAENMNGTAGDTVTWSVNPETKTLTFSGSGEVSDFEEYPPYRSFSKYIENVEFSEDSAITRFGDFAFAGLKNLETLTLSEGTTSIGSQCFYNSGLKVLNLPASWSTLSIESFIMGTTPIEAINVTNGSKYFYSCNGALYFVVSDPDYGTFYQLIKMPEAAYDGTFAENTYVTLPASFENYQATSSVVLPDSVIGISEATFYNCPSLETIKIGTGKGGSFDESLQTMEIDEDFAYGCGNLTSIEVDERNTEYTSVDGMLCNKDVTTLVYCPRAKETAVIPSTVTEIGLRAFNGCYKIESVVIPESVIRISRSAFEDCWALESVSFAENGELTEIGRDAFDSCGLRTVVIPASVTKIEEYAFGGCNNLTDITVMNASCTIESYWGTLGNDDTIVHGHIGSTAEDYADKYSRKFQALNGAEMTSISVDTSAAKMQYQQYDSFDTGGIVVTAHYSDGTSVVKTNGVSYSGFDSSTIGVCTVTVTFRDFTTQFDVAIGEIPAEEITLNSSVSADVNSLKEVYFKFVPEKSGTVKFYSSESSKNTVGRIYDSNLTYLSGNYGYYDFSFEYDVTAGETYYLSVRFNSSSSTGTINV